MHTLPFRTYLKIPFISSCIVAIVFGFVLFNLDQYTSSANQFFALLSIAIGSTLLLRMLIIGFVRHICVKSIRQALDDDYAATALLMVDYEMFNFNTYMTFRQTFPTLPTLVDIASHSGMLLDDDNFNEMYRSYIRRNIC